MYSESIDDTASRAADLLGITRKTLLDKIEEYELDL
ncbi:MAG: hypothetical protein KJ621_17720 [Proteobacteria bacterium]|nr:hypothetical protein [Pseudomonadota bacterium]MBU1741073.1 hypothetical protein [Pseudomonadota bacterium]